MRIIDIIRKDLLLFLSDKRRIIILVLMPMVIMTILGIALSGAFEIGTEFNQLEIAIVKEYDNADSGRELDEALSNKLVQQFVSKENINNMKDGIKDFDIEYIFEELFLEVEQVKEMMHYKYMTMNNATELLEKEKIDCIVVLPENFVSHTYLNMLLPKSFNININVIGRTDNKIKTEIIRSLMYGFTSNIQSVMIQKNVFLATLLDEGLPIDGNEMIEVLMNNVSNEGIVIEEKALEGTKIVSSAAYYSIAIMAMFVLYTAGVGSRGLLMEKQLFTYNRLSSAGANKIYLLIGKYVVNVVAALLQMTILMLYTYLVLKVSWGNPVPVYIFLVIIALVVGALGTLLSAISFKVGNYKMADVFQNGIIYIFAALGGSFLPVNVLPSFIQKISDYIINGAIIKALIQLASGKSLMMVSNYIGIIAIQGILFFTFALIIFKREVKNNA